MSDQPIEIWSVPTLPDISRLEDGVWVLHATANTTLYPDPDDNRIPHTERPLTHPAHQQVRLLGLPEAGTTNENAYCYANERRQTVPGHYATATTKYLVVSSQPFAAVMTHDQPDSLQKCQLARQVRRGIMAGHAPIQEDLGVTHSKIRDPRRPLDDPCALNWVPIWRITDITGLTPTEILGGFADFSPSSVNFRNVPTLYMPPQIAVNADIVRLYADPLPDDNLGFCYGESAWGGEGAMHLADLNTEGLRVLYVPHEFARTVIRLHRSGYRLDGMQSGPLLAAAAPTRPAHQFPILSTEELRPLRMQLPGSWTEEQFRATALRALGFAPEDDKPEQSQWYKTPLSDDGGSFCYYVGFEQIQRHTDVGTVVIGSCFWTRGGEEPGEPFAGFLAVFPAGIDPIDARRDSSAILRLWFWPDSVVRQTPAGSVGGFCPPEVPAECAALVDRFMLGLGYDY